MATQEPAGRNRGRAGGHAPAGAAGNPLMRTSDRVQHWIGVLLVLLLVVGVPLASVAVGVATYHYSARVARTQSAARHAAQARVLEDVAGADDGFGGQSAPRVPARVRLTEPDGAVRTATARIEAGTRAGTVVRVWVDGAGRVTEPPLDRSEAFWYGGFGAATAAAVTALVALGVWRGARRTLDRRRFAQWDEEWARVEPQWSRRR